jgi:hypothetical protein
MAVGSQCKGTPILRKSVGYVNGDIIVIGRIHEGGCANGIGMSLTNFTGSFTEIDN